MDKHSSVIIGSYLREERKKRHLSIDKLALRTELSSSQISVIERGFNTTTGKYINITLTSLELIGEALGLSVQEILENSGYNAHFNQIILNNEQALQHHLKSLFDNPNTLTNEYKKSIIEQMHELLDYHDFNDQ